MMDTTEILVVVGARFIGRLHAELDDAHVGDIGKARDQNIFERRRDGGQRQWIVFSGQGQQRGSWCGLRLL